MAELFEKAFGREASAGGPRPAAAEWVATLEALEARPVTGRDDPRHAHARGQGAWLEELRQVILDGIGYKPWGHGLAEGVIPLNRVMSEIGG